MRYTKYKTHGAIHWIDYKRGRNYKDLVDDSLKPFKDIEKGTLIEIGCGDGVSACKLSELGFKVTGVEMEELGIKYAKKNCNEDIDWKCMDVEDFLQHCIDNDLRFDYLYSLNAIEHFKRDKVMIDLMKRVNKFGIIITDDAVTCKKGNKFHEREYTREEFKKLFKGFKLKEIDIGWDKFFGYKIMK